MFRGWAGGARLDLLTDGRSAKALQLARQPAVELCWLLPRARCQFRLRGQVLALPWEIERHERERHWRTLTSVGRALWGWPAPGAPLESEAPFPAELAADAALPDHFRLLRIDLAQVELLELMEQPHRRRRWRAETGWSEERQNP